MKYLKNSLIVKISVWTYIYLFTSSIKYNYFTQNNFYLNTKKTVFIEFKLGSTKRDFHIPNVYEGK